MRIIFFGTPRFAAEVLSYLIDQDIEIAAVVTRADKPKGRSDKQQPTPVKSLLLEKAPNIPIFQPEKVSAPEFAGVLPPFEADLFVVVAYGEIVKQHILDIPKHGCINLHASLLPKYRGAAPIQRSIMEGEKETGLTVIRMVKKMDAGDMLKKAVVPIGQDDTFPEIEQRLIEKGSELLLNVIRDFENGEVIETPQDETQVTYAAKIELKDTEIDWNLPATQIHNLVRGVSPYPGAWCFVQVKGDKKRLKVLKTQVETEASEKPGEILSCSPDGMFVGTGMGVLKILELQLEGKRAMPPEDLLRGTTIHFIG